MQLFLIAAVVLAVALGLVYFMGKKAPRQGSGQANPQTPSQQPQPPAPPQNTPPQ